MLVVERVVVMLWRLSEWGLVIVIMITINIYMGEIVDSFLLCIIPF